MVSMFVNNSYKRSGVRVRALERHTLICMFNVRNEGIISSAYLCNGSTGRLLFELPGRDSGTKGSCSVYRSRLYMTVPHDRTLGRDPLKRIQLWGSLLQIKFRLNSALTFTFTVTSEGLFAPLELCVCLLGATIIVLHSFLAQYFDPSMVYIPSFPVEIPLCQI
jgi:hypothetical protein